MLKIISNRCENHYLFYQDTTDNMVLMICLNPVTEIDDSVKRGLFTSDTDVLSKLKCKTFKEILMTDATTEDGETEVAKYFGVQKQWDELTDQWCEKKKKSQVTSGITNFYFLSNQKVRWTMYGSASSRECIVMQL
jgi:hypothetical protein